MKHIYFILLLLISFPIISQDVFVDLSNKSTNESVKQVESIKEENKVNNRVRDIIYNSEIIPKSIYIGELGDTKIIDKFNVEILNFVDDFFKNINSNNLKSYINTDFHFIFSETYKDKLLSKNILFWLLGTPYIDEDRSNLNIELHLRDKIIVGTIFLEYKDQWYITDLQIRDQEKGIFYPSSNIPIN